MLGTMLHPYELAVPKLAVGVSVQQGGKWVKEDLPTPAILTSSWQSPAGKVGHLLVNIAEDKQTLRVSVDTRNARGGKPYDVELYRSAEGAAFRPLWQRVQLPKEFVAELAPGEIVFLSLQGVPP